MCLLLRVVLPSSWGENVFTCHVKCFVQNIVILVEMCQKKIGTLFVALNSELRLSHSKVTEVSVKECVNAVKD